MITKRTFLRGLFAAPAIVAASSLMEIRGVSLVRPEELSNAEIVALLERRIDAAMGQMQIEMSRQLYGDVHGSMRVPPMGAPAHTRYDSKSLAVPFAFIPT